MAISPVQAVSAYDQATAGNPDYENKELWPKLTGKEKFLTQKYEPGRVMEWAKPGEGIGGRDGLDAWDPQNWLLDGKPATEVRFDENTDIILPNSDTPYTLDFKRTEGWQPLYRHVTVGRNADLLHEGVRYFGNLWVKKGGVNNARHSNSFMGGHTFVRDDNGTYEDAHSGRIGQYFFLRKESQETTLEILGNVSMLDRVPVDSGTLIIGADCRFSPGRNATMVIAEGATVALLDGARLVKWVNQIGQLDLIIFGTLQGGLPDRPLTRPAFVELGYQNTTGVTFYDKVPRAGETVQGLEERVASMTVGPKAVIRSISANPEGLLHLRWSGIDAADWHLGAHGPAGDWFKSLNPEQAAYVKEQLAAIPKKLTVIFQEGASIDGLVLNDFHAGGLLMEKPEDFAGWQRLVMGERNDATGEKLIARIGRATVNDNVKNPGGEYQLGVPEVFATEEVEGEGWASHVFTAKAPAEAAGQRLGIRFSRPHGSNWIHLDNVVVRVAGQDVIVNGGFEEPKDAEIGKKSLPLPKAPPWQNMSAATTNVGIGKNEKGRFAAFFNNDTSFGQTTGYVVRGGEEIEVSFDANITGGPLQAELFTMSGGL